MASKKQYSAEFKIKVAEEAAEQPEQDVHSLAQKYDVPVSAVLTWRTQFENKGPAAFRDEDEAEEQPIKDHETVDVEVRNPDIADSIGYGVMLDRLNYPRLIFWSVLGVVLFVIFIIALVQMFQYNSQVTREQIAGSSEYYQVTELNRQAEETLNSFGIVDMENGIYRIPIDSAINDIAAD